MPPTIRDVAARAGVSVSAVSHFLNGRHKRVSVDTRQRIIQAIDHLGYHPNSVARSLVRQKTGLIGLLVTELTNPLFAPVTGAVEEITRRHGYKVMLCGALTEQEEAEALEAFKTSRVEGVIMMSLSIRRPNSPLQALEEEGVPVVVINRPLAPGDTWLDAVFWDDEEVAYLATTHLIRLGHTRIGHLQGPIEGPVTWESARWRARGFQRAMQQHGLAPEPAFMLDGNYSYAGGYGQAMRLLQAHPRPTAIVAANDRMAVGAIKAARALGLSVPRDVAVVGIGDEPYAVYTDPSLTTVALPVDQAGHQAAQKLLHRLLNPSELHVSETTHLPGRLVIRESCGSPGATLS